MKAQLRASTLMAVLVLISPLAAVAQGFAQGNTQSSSYDVQIQVKDLDSDRVIAAMRPGGTVTLREGQRVRLILSADPPGRGSSLVYPETEFTESEPGRGWVRVTRTNVENANATLRIVRPASSSRVRAETLHYRIVEDIGLPDHLREGDITVRVEPVASSAVASTQRARDLTRRLYQGILMRDMDEAGARSQIESIVSGGYPALIQVAERIAKSDESRIRVYEREGVCNEQRLLSLYKNLLGLSADQIDSEQWEADLRRMNAGQIDAVVVGMVRSTRFQQIHNLDRVAIRY